VRVLVVAPTPRKSIELTELGETGYVVVGDADPTTMERLAVELRASSIEGAVLLTELRVDRFPLAREFPRHLVVDEPDEHLVDELGSLGWTQLDQFEGRVVLAPPALSSTVRLVSRQEFAAGIDGSEPLATEIDVERVRLDDEALFGVFASSQLGGSCALLSLSGDGQASHGTLRLRNPAALGLERADSHPDSLSVRATEGSVVYSAIGLSARGSPEAWSEREELEGWREFEDTAAARQLWDSPERTDRDYWVVLQLRAPTMDPPVWMPAGQIFEQQRRTGRQTLATTAPVGAVVTPGHPTTLAVPTFCLDPQLRGPAEDPMRLTPLRVRAHAGTTQGAAWQARHLARESER
jgi:hypothetical protein